METISKEKAERVFNVLKDAIKFRGYKFGFINRETFYDYIEEALDKYYSILFKE